MTEGTERTLPTDSLAESSPRQYRKKPLPVTAYLWQGEAFGPSHLPPGKIHSIYTMLGGRVLGTINTAEGPVTIAMGEHYIVGPGAGGEFWPVRKDIFEETYERI